MKVPNNKTGVFNGTFARPPVSFSLLDLRIHDADPFTLPEDIEADRRSIVAYLEERKGVSDYWNAVIGANEQRQGNCTIALYDLVLQEDQFHD